MTTSEMIKAIVEAMEEKKALDMKALKVEALTSLSDYFLICTGTSTTHLKSIADEIEKKLKDKGVLPHHIEGYAAANWILLDYGHVLVHVFLNETRMFYSLERLWNDAQSIDIDTIKTMTDEER